MSIFAYTYSLHHYALIAISFDGKVIRLYLADIPGSCLMARLPLKFNWTDSLMSFLLSYLIKPELQGLPVIKYWQINLYLDTSIKKLETWLKNKKS